MVLAPSTDRTCISTRLPHGVHTAASTMAHPIYSASQTSKNGGRNLYLHAAFHLPPALSFLVVVLQQCFLSTLSTLSIPLVAPLSIAVGCSNIYLSCPSAHVLTPPKCLKHYSSQHGLRAVPPSPQSAQAILQRQPLPPVRLSLERPITRSTWRYHSSQCFGVLAVLA